MGYLCEGKCAACGYRQMFRLGSGRKDWNPKKIYSHFETMELWEVKVKELEKRSAFLNFRFRLGRCKDCGKLQEVPEVIFEDGSTFRSSMCSCDSKKEHEIELIDDDATQSAPCPKCGGKVRLQKRGLWD